MSNPLNLLPIDLDDPTWASDIISNFLIINTHNHANNSDSGISISVHDVSCLTDLHFLGVSSFVNQVVSVAFRNLSDNLTTKNTLFVKDDELFFSNGIAFPVQISKQGTLNVTTLGGGGFTGKPNNFNSFAQYTSATDIYIFYNSNPAPITIICNNITLSSQNSSVSVYSTSIASFNTLVCLNITPIVNDGNYLLSQTGTYSPTLTAQPFSLFATTPPFAVGHIAQLFNNNVQRAISTSYTTSFFAFITSMFFQKLGAQPLENSFFRAPTPFQDGTGLNFTLGVAPTTTLAFFKGQGLLFSVYRRNGTNFPPIIRSDDSSGVTLIKYSINATYKASNFTSLSWTRT